jgi:pyruvate dehydrogenase E2 component (dihydrolipoamide acetyltransferase)
VPIEVKMAKLSPTMESGQLVKWLVKVGDPVKEGDTLAEIQTDKAVMPMEAFDEGTVARLDVQEGDEIALGQRVLVLAQKGEDPKAVAEALGGAAAPAAAPKAPPTAAPVPPESIATDSNGQERPRCEAPAVAEPAAVGGRVKSSPLARKIAATNQIDLRQVQPSGPGGRVIRRDVEAFLQQRPKEPPPAPPAARPTAPAKPLAKPERLPLSRMGLAIAKGMVESKRSAPDIHVTVDIRVDELVKIRERLNQRLAAEQIKLSLSDFVTKAVALALRRHPALNATFEGTNDNLAQAAIVRHAEVNLGIAVALPDGLIVPVLRNADTLGLREIRVQSEALFQAARQTPPKLTSDQMIGATFTISNLGMYGVRQFDAVINLPQVAILAVAAAEKRPIVVNDELTIGTMMTVTISADHRAVNGAEAAEFLRTLKGLLEEPASMLL